MITLMHLMPLMKLRFKEVVITFSLIILLSILLYYRVIPREKITIPFETVTLNLILKVCLAITIVLVMLIKDTINRKGYLIKQNAESKYEIILEKLKKHIDFIAIFLNKNIIKFQLLYNYLWKNPNSLLYIYVSLSIIPRMFVIFIFIYDIFINHALFYFFKILPCLMISLIFQIFLYFFKRFNDIESNTLQPKVQAFANYLDKGIAGIIPLKTYIHETSLKLLKKSKEASNATLLLDPDYVYSWETKTGYKADLKSSLELYKKAAEKLILNHMVFIRFFTQLSFYGQPISIIIRVCYAISWSYILYISTSLSCYDVLNFILAMEDSSHQLFVEEPFSGVF